MSGTLGLCGIMCFVLLRSLSRRAAGRRLSPRNLEQQSLHEALHERGAGVVVLVVEVQRGYGELAAAWSMHATPSGAFRQSSKLPKPQPAAISAPLLFQSDGDHVARPGTQRFCHHQPFTPKIHAAVSQNIIRETESPTKATVLLARRPRASRRPRRGGSQGIFASCAVTSA